MERRKANMSSGEKEESSPLTEKPRDPNEIKATQCSRIQAPVQCCLRPAMWVPGLNQLHSHREKWKTEGSTSQINLDSVREALPRVIQADKTNSDFIVSKVESNFLQIQVVTRAEWLDVIEMWFEDNEIKISAFSSGFLPLCLPGACLFNLAFFWMPFSDMGMNAKRLKWIVSQMNIPVTRSRSWSSL
ncbi:uncharacterized protein [Littorina saxatilis]|uniref:Uncharacterized protein n=1 Tax=Littorina saxatilis TaxID=31220 RepID=A0AAN9AJY8_9CAEN